jgi:DNA repair exonuclease SbcCD ATPase subunit
MKVSKQNDHTVNGETAPVGSHAKELKPSPQTVHAHDNPEISQLQSEISSLRSQMASLHTIVEMYQRDAVAAQREAAEARSRQQLEMQQLRQQTKDALAALSAQTSNPTSSSSIPSPPIPTPSTPSTDIASLEAAVAALQAATDSGLPSRVAAIEELCAGMQQTVDSLATESSSADKEALASVTASIERIDNKLEDIVCTVEPIAPAVAALRSDVDKLLPDATEQGRAVARLTSQLEKVQLDVASAISTAESATALANEAVPIAVRQCKTWMMTAAMADIQAHIAPLLRSAESAGAAASREARGARQEAEEALRLAQTQRATVESAVAAEEGCRVRVDSALALLEGRLSQFQEQINTLSVVGSGASAPAEAADGDSKDSRLFVAPFVSRADLSIGRNNGHHFDVPRLDALDTRVTHLFVALDRLDCAVQALQQQSNDNSVKDVIDKEIRRLHEELSLSERRVGDAEDRMGLRCAAVERRVGACEDVLETVHQVAGKADGAVATNKQLERGVREIRDAHSRVTERVSIVETAATTAAADATKQREQLLRRARDEGRASHELVKSLSERVRVLEENPSAASGGDGEAKPPHEGLQKLKSEFLRLIQREQESRRADAARLKRETADSVTTSAESIKQDISAAISRVRRVEKGVDDVKSRNNELSAKIDEMASADESLNEKLDKSTKQLKTLKERLDTSVSSLQDTDSRVQGISADVDALRSSVTEHTDRLNPLEAKCCELREAQHVTATSIDALRKRADGADVKLVDNSELIGTLMVKVDDMGVGITEAKIKLAQELADVASSVSALENRSSQSQHHVDALCSGLGSLHSAVRELCWRLLDDASGDSASIAAEAPAQESVEAKGVETTTLGTEIQTTSGSESCLACAARTAIQVPVALPRPSAPSAATDTPAVPVPAPRPSSSSAGATNKASSQRASTPSSVSRLATSKPSANASSQKPAPELKVAPVASVQYVDDKFDKLVVASKKHAQAVKQRFSAIDEVLNKIQGFTAGNHDGCS